MCSGQVKFGQGWRFLWGLIVCMPGVLVNTGCGINIPPTIWSKASKQTNKQSMLSYKGYHTEAYVRNQGLSSRLCYLLHFMLRFIFLDIFSIGRRRHAVPISDSAFFPACLKILSLCSEASGQVEA